MNAPAVVPSSILDDQAFAGLIFRRCDCRRSTARAHAPDVVTTQPRVADGADRTGGAGEARRPPHQLDGVAA